MVTDVRDVASLMTRSMVRGFDTGIRGLRAWTSRRTTSTYASASPELFSTRSMLRVACGSAVDPIVAGQ